MDLRTNARLMLNVVLNPRSHRAEVLFTGSPPFMLLFSFLAKLIRGAKLTYRITDFFPEVIAADSPFSERMCRHFTEDLGITTRIARYHNVYGPYGTWDGGREKAPAAICRKVAMALISGDNTIEIWGDGKQTRSFMYIDDCLIGSQMLMRSCGNRIMLRQKGESQN